MVRLMRTSRIVVTSVWSQTKQQDGYFIPAV
jgi:hypothetical protein